MKNTQPVMKVSAVDLKAQYATLREELLQSLHEILESQLFILGPKVAQLEKEIAAYCETSHAVGVASGTDALLLGLRAVGVERGNEVVTTPFSFFATAGAIHNVGAVPVFVDVDPQTLNIDPRKIEAKLTSRTKAIIPVHLFGQSADMKPIMEVARKHGLKVIEDAAQSIGARYCLDGTWKRAGSMGDLGCISFFPSKNLGGLGDGGMVVTNDATVDERVRLLRAHGGRTRYLHDIVGYNSRLDALQAAALLVKLKYLEGWSAARRSHAQVYDRLFRQTDLCGSAKTPFLTSQSESVFNQYVIRAERRDELRAFLEERGVSTAIYYPLPLHLQPCFRFLNYQPGDLPEAEKACAEVLALPLYPELTETMQEYVVAKIAEFYRN